MRSKPTHGAFSELLSPGLVHSDSQEREEKVMVPRIVRRRKHLKKLLQVPILPCKHFPRQVQSTR